MFVSAALPGLSGLMQTRDGLLHHVAQNIPRFVRAGQSWLSGNQKSPGKCRKEAKVESKTEAESEPPRLGGCPFFLEQNGKPPDRRWKCSPSDTDAALASMSLRGGGLSA